MFCDANWLPVQTWFKFDSESDRRDSHGADGDSRPNLGYWINGCWTWSLKLEYWILILSLNIADASWIFAVTEHHVTRKETHILVIHYGPLAGWTAIYRIIHSTVVILVSIAEFAPVAVLGTDIQLVAHALRRFLSSATTPNLIGILLSIDVTVSVSQIAVTRVSVTPVAGLCPTGLASEISTCGIQISLEHSGRRQVFSYHISCVPNFNEKRVP